MFDYQKVCEDKIAFYSRPEFVERPDHPAGFRGTFKFTDHKLIPDVYLGFLQRHFGVLRLSRVSLDAINEIMNEVWEGPGSLTKLFTLEEEMRLNGRVLSITPMDYVKAKKSARDDEEDQESDEELTLPLFESDEEDDNA